MQNLYYTIKAIIISPYPANPTFSLITTLFHCTWLMNHGIYTVWSQRKWRGVHIALWKWGASIVSKRFICFTYRTIPARAYTPDPIFPESLWCTQAEVLFEEDPDSFLCYCSPYPLFRDCQWSHQLAAPVVLVTWFSLCAWWCEHLPARNPTMATKQLSDGNYNVNRAQP